MVDGEKILPFVRAFYGKPSSYWWEDDVGDVHAIQQGEGGEQGDPLMPILFCLGQHAALASVKRELLEGEQLFAFLDDLYVVCKPEMGCRSSQDPLKQIVGARPHLTPRGKDEGVEQEWRGAQRLSSSSRSSSVGHSRSCRVERRQEFADLPAGVQGPRHSVWPPGFHQQFLEREDRESPDPS